MGNNIKTIISKENSKIPNKRWSNQNARRNERERERAATAHWMEIAWLIIESYVGLPSERNMIYLVAAEIN